MGFIEEFECARVLGFWCFRALGQNLGPAMSRGLLSDYYYFYYCSVIVVIIVTRIIVIIIMFFKICQKRTTSAAFNHASGLHSAFAWLSWPLLSGNARIPLASTSATLELTA